MIAQLPRDEEQAMLDSLKLLHFHIGSQITKIDKIKSALIEGARVYAELRRRFAPHTARWCS